MTSVSLTLVCFLCVRYLSPAAAAKLAPVAFNIKKLSIVCVVEDEKVSIEELTERIEQFEDFVQSVDIAGFNKI